MSKYLTLINIFRLVALVGVLLFLILGLDSSIAWVLFGSGLTGAAALDLQEQFAKSR